MRDDPWMGRCSTILEESSLTNDVRDQIKYGLYLFLTAKLLEACNYEEARISTILRKYLDNLEKMKPSMTYETNALQLFIEEAIMHDEIKPFVKVMKARRCSCGKALAMTFGSPLLE